MVYIREWNGVRNRYPSLVLFPNGDVWWFLIETNAESFQLCFNYFLVP